MGRGLAKDGHGRGYAMMADRATEPRNEHPRTRWPAGFVGMLALMVAVEAGIVRAGREIGTLTSADWRRDRQAATSEAATTAEILCFGDSQIKTGIAPAALEARLDRSVYNLAAMGSPTPVSYFLFKRALDAGARPRAIVLDAHEAQLWGGIYRHYVAAWAELVGPVEAFQIARDDGDLGFFGLYLTHLIPSVRFRLDVRKAVVGAVAEEPRDPEIPWDPVVVRHYRRNRGALLFHADPPEGRTRPLPRRPDPAGRRGALLSDRANGAEPTNLVYLDKMLALARSRGIPVFFVLAPIHPGVLTLRERAGLEAQYEGLIRKIHDRYENVTVVDARHAGFEHGAFVDACHLSCEGATVLSNGLAEVIAARLGDRGGADRWVALPRFVEPTARLAVESLDESQFAVSWQSTRR